MNLVVAYDISSDRRRQRVAKLLGAVGARIQLSVFECLVGSPEVDDLAATIASVIDARVDRVHVFPTCDACVERRRLIGTADSPLTVRYFIV